MQEYMKAQEVMFFVLTHFEEDFPNHQFSASSKLPPEDQRKNLPFPYDNIHYHVHHNSNSKEQKQTCQLLHYHVCFKDVKKLKGKKCRNLEGKKSPHQFPIIITWEKPK